MLDWMKETESIWQRLIKTKKPVVLYGMGDGAAKIKAVLDSIKVPVAAIFASDEFVRGHSFLGYKVMKLEEVKAKFPDFFVLLCFAVRDEPSIDKVFKISEDFELAVPDVPVAGDTLFDDDFFAAHEQDFDKIYKMLADAQSKEVYANILSFKLSGRPEYLKNCTTSTDEFYNNILKLNSKEVYADLGAYRGETIREFLGYTNNKYEKIIALEPDYKNYKKLSQTIKDLSLENAFCYNLAAYKSKEKLIFNICAGRQSAISEINQNNILSKNINKNIKPEGMATLKQIEVDGDSLDNLMSGERVSFINMDVEGAEKEAIEGCRGIIKEHKPKLLISAYHRSEDMFALPLQIAEIRNDYKFYFRHTLYLPGWDTNLFCV